jgi:hypothetical protein
MYLMNHSGPSLADEAGMQKRRIASRRVLVVVIVILHHGWTLPSTRYGVSVSSGGVPKLARDHM